MAVRLEMIMAVPSDLLIALNEAEHAVPVQSLLCAVSNSAKNFAAVQKARWIFRRRICGRAKIACGKTVNDSNGRSLP
jgi:hypothetical protein